MKPSHLVFGAMLLSGCSGSVDVGPGGGQSAGSAGATDPGRAGNAGSSAGSIGSPLTGPLCTLDTPLPVWPTATDCIPDDSLTITGTWHGYVELAQPPWDDFTLVIKGKDANGNVCGTFTLGSGPALRPATDPSVGYPVNQNVDSVAAVVMVADPVLGVPLSLFGSKFDGTRLTFSAAYNEVRRTWCQLQTSYAEVVLSCACVPASSSGGADENGCYFNDDAGHKQSVNCSKWGLCLQGACACNSAGCDGNPSGANTSFDLRFSGNTAEGQNSATFTGRTYFTRQP